MRPRITPVYPTDEPGIEAAYLIEAAALAQDVPDLPPLSRTEHVGQFRFPHPATRRHCWLAELAGRPAGVLAVELPILDNLETAWVSLTVHPDLRRRGVGRALHSHAVDAVRALGRHRLMGDYVTQIDGGPRRDAAPAAFASAVGAKAALPEVRRRLDLAEADLASWDRILADAWTHARGYSIVRWTKAVPAEHAADVAALDSRLLLDAPLGELALEPERVDVARVRATERMAADRGRRMYHSAIRHDGSGRLVAWTAIGFDGDETAHAWQQITIVDPEHRGHRLGLITKIDNLWHAQAAEPAFRYLHTWNAAENTHMIAINQTLGFRAVDGWTDWQQEV